MTDLLKRKNGEGYVDVAVTVMIVAFVLLFAVNMVSLVALNQNMKTAADQLVEYASQKGTTAIHRTRPPFRIPFFKGSPVRMVEKPNAHRQ